MIKIQIEPIDRIPLRSVLFICLEAKSTKGEQRYAIVNPTTNGKHISENV
jgi:hypothetical protein